MTQTTAIERVPNNGIRITNVALWVLQLGVAYLFFNAGWSKLTGAPAMVGVFDAIGVGQWFRYLTGALEFAGAIALLIPALSGIGALVLTGVMVGAVAAHLFILGGSPTIALVLLLASAIIAWSRRNRTAGLLKSVATRR